jgi:hypothetical protein
MRTNEFRHDRKHKFQSIIINEAEPIAEWDNLPLWMEAIHTETWETVFVFEKEGKFYCSAKEKCVIYSDGEKVWAKPTV